MNKREYFIEAINSGAYQFTDWTIAAFSVATPATPKSEADIVPMILHRDEKGFTFEPNGSGDVAWVRIEDGDISKPLFDFREKLHLKAGDLPNVYVDVETTYGQALANALLLIYPFRDKIPYISGRFGIPEVEKIIERRCVDDYDSMDEMMALKGPDAPLFVWEFKKFNEAAASMVGYTQLAVPSATAKSLTTSPDVIKRRQELMDQYRDQLDDPVIQARIEQELIKIDKDWIKGDEAEDFYNKGKYYDVIRKKRFLVHGAESGLGVTGKVIETALEEGWDINNLPEMANGLRDGSHSRGAQTALGGEATKFNYRMYQNSVVIPGDCGSRLGLRTLVPTKSDAGYLVGSYYIDGDSNVLITEENVEAIVGKAIDIRSPLYCQTEGVNYCACCMGDKVSKTPDALAAYAADVSSAFMLAAMKAMHGKALRTHKYDFKLRLT